jgi:hypothetical protein
VLHHGDQFVTERSYGNALRPDSLANERFAERWKASLPLLDQSMAGGQGQEIGLAACYQLLRSGGLERTDLKAN